MSVDTANLNAFWADLIVEELIRNGVTTFVISPGSRSTPLTLAVARNRRATSVVHFDERGAAFFALGVARARRGGCAVISTSGTAAANHLPAVVEASQLRVPLIVLTADRPPELLDTGANQTIDQNRLFGVYARWYCALPCPDAAIAPEYVLSTVDQAVARAHAAPAGPVHVNCAFREPLAPPAGALPTRYETPVLARWRKNRSPYTRYVPTDYADADELDADTRAAIRGAQRGLLLIGASSFGDSRAIRAAAGRSKWPVWADIASGARGGTASPPNVPYYDQMLLAESFRAQCAPDVVVHIGGPVTSKRVNRLLSESPPRHYIRVTDSALRDDPQHRVTMHLARRDAAAFLRKFCAAAKTSPTWMKLHTQANSIVADTLAARDRRARILDEIAVARIVSANIGKRTAALFLGNSMPVRDFDFYGDARFGRDVLANRGASGIDGNIATAAGYSFAAESRVVAVIGDLAALHDLSALALLRLEGVRVTLIIVNNDGGGIFHFLPIAEHGDVFERFFGTPHGLRFHDAARMMSLPHGEPRDTAELRRLLRTFQHADGSNVIEVNSDRAQNARAHRTLAETIAQRLES